jgi:hypothetical protein
VSDEYDAMSREELLIRVKDWRQVANDRSVEIQRLTDDVERLRGAIVEATKILASDGVGVEYHVMERALRGHLIEMAAVKAENERLRPLAYAARVWLANGGLFSIDLVEAVERLDSPGPPAPDAEVPPGSSPDEDRSGGAWGAYMRGAYICPTCGGAGELPRDQQGVT